MSTGTWRVQWFSRPEVGRPETRAGLSDFADEVAARTHFETCVRQLVSEVWRAELQYQPPVPAFETVERSEYLDPSAVGGESR